MFSKGVSRRWMVNTTGVVFFILVVSITTLSLMVQSSTYNGIELSLAGRADELLNWLFINAGQSSSSSFSGIVRDYIEDFQDKNNMEIMALDQNGRVFITSTGFEPDQDQKMPDYEAALRSSSGAGKWVGHLDTGEKAMAITRVVRDENGGLVGSVRYLVSMERADQQISVVILILVAAGLFIMLLLTLSGVYFIRSIVVPVRQLSQSARQIAQGDFDVRIEKAKDDEIGQLVDAINDMAGELGAAEQLKNDFISSVSHELRTPLTAIKGWAETLQEGAGPETTAKGMNVIIRESERLSGLVEELLDFSRLQNGRLRLIVSRLDILSELDEAVYMFTDRARTEHKQLHYEETTALPPVYGDVDRLRQVFVNIIDNALKYTSPGGTITVSSREDSGWVRVSIRDTGCGIPAEHLPNVKKKFYKANQLVRGSGIGLAVADEIARLHGGSLDIQSQEGVGTTVTISLPTCSHLETDPQLTETPELLKFIQERKP
ncbi:MAG: sensor histidine kinase [Acutalibacter sp.]